VSDERKKHISIPLNGKLITSEPAAIGQNFRTLTNIRYTDTHLKAVAGMTKINTTAPATYLKARSAFHFRKAQPQESHLLSQNYGTGLTASRILDNCGVIPAATDYYEIMRLDVAPATAWSTGDTITGATSTKTCVIVKMLTTLTYVVSGRSGSFTLGETLSNGTVTANQGAANPTFGVYTLWADSTGAGRGYFSNAPDGQVVYANGVDNCIWGGDEMRLGAFITSSAVVGDDGVPTNARDFTERLQNTRTDSESVVTIGGGNDSYCVLLLHGDEADGTGGDDGIQDSSASNHTITAVGGAVTDNAQGKFNNSIYFDGTDDYLTVPDHANWYFGTGDFTIDFWVRPTDNDCGICGQYEDENNYWMFRLLVTTGSGAVTDFKVVSGGVTVARYATSAGDTITLNSWQHVELSCRRSGGGVNVFLFINGVSQALTEIVAMSTNEVPNLNAVLEVGGAYNHTELMKGWLDEFRISKGVARHTTDFSVPDAPYLENPHYFLVGSPRPLQGIKLYINSGNPVASVLTGKVWNGRTWNTLTLTDYTDTGAALAATGKVVFNSTVSTAKPKYIGGYFLYWYQFYLNVGQSTLYQITLDAPFQNIIDIWDGVYRDVAVCYMKTIVYNDFTLNVLRTDYDADTPDTYANLNFLGAYADGNNCLEIGFREKVCGIYFQLPPEYVNTTAATTMSVDYWDGYDYVSVGAIADGTSSGTVSFAFTGVVTWNNTNLEGEVKSDKLLRVKTPIWPFGAGGRTETEATYAYRVRFNKAIAGALSVVRLDYVGGIPVQKKIENYKFPVFAQNRVLLCADMSGEKNKIICSGKNTPQVYSGEDSVDIYFGDENELTCGTELYSQYAGNLYSLVLMFKDNESWIMAGQDIDQWEGNIFPLSSTIGCPAPQTLKTVNLSAEPGQGINRNLAIWQGINGIYMSDGRAPIPIHKDIEKFFDRTHADCIKASMVGESVGFIDPEKQEYHWIFASGTSTTTLNKELVYDIHRNKWFEIDRGSGLDLQCGVLVQDTYGNTYTYGFIDTGYCERLEYGSDFDGTDITATLQTGDFAPMGLEYSTQLDHLRLISVAKTTADTDVTLTHYLNTSTTGTDKTLSLVNTGYRLAKPFFTEKLVGEPFHSVKLAITTDDATCGFEPLAIVATFHVVQSD
jgi:hypothetical protein